MESHVAGYASAKQVAARNRIGNIPGYHISHILYIKGINIIRCKYCISGLRQAGYYRFVTGCLLPHADANFRT